LYSKTELDPDTAVALVKLQQKNEVEYWVGLQNFYVITRYNHSELYAMAVYQLSLLIKDRMKQG
jgi:membrane-bound lytic murein transglycosylase B